jgi:trans-2,3-dihydro-3-hydroxyanthranilate isomerase
VESWTFQIVDVFTETPLAGNQLAVFEDATAIPESLPQALAQEISFSETVFAYPAAEGGDARIRIFTPANEVPFASHPTLGTAVIVAARHRKGKDKERVILETGRGPVPAQIDLISGPATRGTMEQPLPTIALYDNADAFLSALGVTRSVLPLTIYDNGIPHGYAMLERAEDVAALRPDFGALAVLARNTGMPVVGFNVFSGSGRSWKTRMFAPADDIAEDPATGNADHVERIEVSGSAVPVGGGWFDGELLRGTGGV